MGMTFLFSAACFAVFSLLESTEPDFRRLGLLSLSFYVFSLLAHPFMSVHQLHSRINVKNGNPPRGPCDPPSKVSHQAPRPGLRPHGGRGQGARSRPALRGGAG
jgi:hypothetical protein